jgi:hypothetical protein
MVTEPSLSLRAPFEPVLERVPGVVGVQNAVPVTPSSDHSLLPRRVGRTVAALSSAPEPLECDPGVPLVRQRRCWQRQEQQSEKHSYLRNARAGTPAPPWLFQVPPALGCCGHT